MIITNLILKLTQSSQNGVNLYKNFVRLNAEIDEFLFLETNAKFKALNYQKRLNEIDIKKAKILNEAGELNEILSAFV
ncbi:hypothetical protein VWM78_09720, partial [Campylobacter coli]